MNIGAVRVSRGANVLSGNGVSSTNMARVGCIGTFSIGRTRYFGLSTNVARGGCGGNVAIGIARGNDCLVIGNMDFGNNTRTFTTVIGNRNVVRIEISSMSDRTINALRFSASNGFGTVCYSLARGLSSSRSVCLIFGNGFRVSG